MTGWQAQILWDLYARTLARLTGGQRERLTRETVAQRVIEAMRGEVTRTALAAHLALLPERYLATTAPQRIAAHLRLLDRLDEEGVLATELFHHPDLGSSELVVATGDVPGLFSLIAGTLAAQGINILSAQIHTRADGIVIDTFQVNDPFGEAVTEAARWRRTLRRCGASAAVRPASRTCSRAAAACTRGATPGWPVRPRSGSTTSSPTAPPCWR
jgi:[protein-PII] uridylyltransferase